MSHLIDEPMAVVTCSSDQFRYVLAFDPRDLQSVIYRCPLGKGRGVITDRESIPPEVQRYFEVEEKRISDGWYDANPEDERGPLDPDHPDATGDGK